MILKEDLTSINYDLIVVVGQNASLVPILKEAEKLKINPNKVILDRTICVPGFTIDRYKKLRNSQLSILSINCWGGVVYHLFGLPFLSPTINLHFNGRDFLKFLNEPMSYMNKELRFCKINVNKINGQRYPSFYLGDILCTMLHYIDDDSVNTARQKWEERRIKVNWYNLLFKFHTSDEKQLKEFDKMPFSKKICIVPFKTDVDSGFYVDTNNIPPEHYFDIERQIGNPNVYGYDMWDLLLYGKKTPLPIVKK